MVPGMRALLPFCAALLACAFATPPSPAASAALPLAASDDLTCAVDRDCALTWVADGACCAMLCNPRAVTATRSRALAAAHCPSECPAPECAPPSAAPSPACERGRCVVRTTR